MAEESKKMPKLVLFFTRGLSLQQWDELGMFPREVALYKRLVEKGVDVSFVTFGSARDLKYSSRLKGIKILCNRWGLPKDLYEKMIPWLHRKELSQRDLIKTNQNDGADLALKAAQRWNKPLIARSGYLLSDFARRQYGEGSAQLNRALGIENTVFAEANKIVVTTKAMADDIAARVPKSATYTTIIPNYVDSDLFAPPQVENRTNDLVFVGRISSQKNVDSLLTALEPLNAKLTLIGDGDLRPGFEERFSSISDRLTWLGKIKNSDIPGHINSSKIFVLPSLFEGHPKTLLEAMSCGIAVLGANSPGIKESIVHGETGWLCETDPESIREAIKTLLSDADLRAKLGRNARQYVLDTLSLDKVVEMELSVYREVLANA